MERGLYIAAARAKQTETGQAINANNLAQAQTIGFKQDLEQFRAMPVFGPGYPDRVFTMLESPGTNMSPGSVNTTGRSMDVAIKNEDGWFAVQGKGKDAKTGYSRGGDFHVAQDGFLVNGQGQKIVDDTDKPIMVPPAQRIDIGRDGAISVVPEGANPDASVVVGRIKLVTMPMSDLKKGDDGTFYRKDGASMPADASVVVQPGALEASNVSVTSALVEMIELSRSFELQTKVMKAFDDHAGAAAKLMQMA